jgi:predicted component of type VI protein secretion system
VLVGVDGPLDGQLFPIFDGESKLGRGPSCQVRFPPGDMRISGEHALVRHRDGTFTIEALKGDRVTMLNEEPTRGDELKHGDTLTLGASTFRFLSVY